eukprot:691559-Amphidinium_carterae.1
MAQVVRDADQYKQFDATVPCVASACTLRYLLDLVKVKWSFGEKAYKWNGEDQTKPNQEGVQALSGWCALQFDSVAVLPVSCSQDIDSDNSGVIEYEEFIQALDIEDKTQGSRLISCKSVDIYVLPRTTRLPDRCSAFLIWMAVEASS